MAREPRRLNARGLMRVERRETILPILKGTVRGQEAAMYGAIRDLFIEVLGYAAERVIIDIGGIDGRPDVTVRADAGDVATSQRSRLVDWIVVEAKTQPRVFATLASRERVFATKAKYVTPYTAWFVMVDPLTIVARPVDAPLSAAADIVIELDAAHGIDAVGSALRRLRAEVAGIPAAMARFRDGDLTLIAHQKLSPSQGLSPARLKVARRRFSAALKSSAQDLCEASNNALKALSPAIEELRSSVVAFQDKYARAVVAAVPPIAHASASSREEQKAMESDARELRLALQRSRHVAKLAVDVLPKFAKENGEIPVGVYKKFAIQSAHLLLARILLLRFLEDNGFFGERRYMCNGGVKAFQELFRYFGTNYSRLLEQAYGEGAKVYAAAFDANDLDWIISVETPDLSRAIESTLFQLSQFDFRTVRGDVLNGIYERFQDDAQRKLLGEFYTPPSIAEYMLRKVGVGPTTRIFDPACGSGTFLIGAYDLIVGDDAARGIADYDSARRVLENLAGNDLNGFSATLAQIQLLWHLMPFQTAMMDGGLPPLRITENINSLRLRRIEDLPTQYDEIDKPIHDVVVGNPPYVRSERTDGGLDLQSAKYYADAVGKMNMAGLFIHRSLAHWCSDAPDAPGKLAFVLPAGVFDGDEYVKLRRTFAPGSGSRRRITGIVDLEAIHQQVFPDAKVIPVLFFAEIGDPTWEDKIEVSTPGYECLEPSIDGERPVFRLERARTWRVTLRDILIPICDHRILTRIRPGRARVLRRLRRARTMESIAAKFWVQKQKAQISDWRGVSPRAGDSVNWQERRAIGGGMTFRGVEPENLPGEDPAARLWKGQNIVTGRFVGSPLIERLDRTQSDDPGLMRYRSALPQRGWVFPQITLAPCCAPIDRDEDAFDNTVTLFFPDEEGTDFPFDLLMASRVYTWLYAVGHRMGLLSHSNGRSHLYSTNLRKLPVPANLAALRPALEALRHDFETACMSVSRSVDALGVELQKVPAVSIKQGVREAKARLTWSDAFDRSTTTVMGQQAELKGITAVGEGEAPPSRIGFDDLLTFIEVDDHGLAERMVAGLSIQERPLGRTGLLDVRIPATKEALVVWRATIASFSANDVAVRFETAMHALDTLVTEALGLDPKALQFMLTDLRTDPVLSTIRPRLAGAEPRAQGLVTSLKSRTRYQASE